jgi:hypothetical protein
MVSLAGAPMVGGTQQPDVCLFTNFGGGFRLSVARRLGECDQVNLKEVRVLQTPIFAESAETFHWD